MIDPVEELKAMLSRSQQRYDEAIAADDLDGIALHAKICHILRELLKIGESFRSGRGSN